MHLLTALISSLPGQFEVNAHLIYLSLHTSFGFIAARRSSPSDKQGVRKIYIQTTIYVRRIVRPRNRKGI